MQARLWRYGLSAPLAGSVTLGLGLMMQAAAAVDFTPQPSHRIGVHSVNPYVEIVVCDCSEGRQALFMWNAIRTYPAPIGQVAVTDSVIQNPHDDQAPYVAPSVDLSLYMPQVDFEVSTRHDPVPHSRRISPKIPPRFLVGNHSGYCKLRFDLSETGRPENIEVVICTDEILRDASIKSVRKWQYGVTDKDAKRIGVKTTVRFDLMDENGVLLPLPEGY